MTVLSVLAAAILEKRLAKNRTQQQIADAVGVSLRTYQNAEQGDHMVRVETVLKLIFLLEIDVRIFKPVVYFDEICSTTQTERTPRPRKKKE